jgi:hypothetical protein
MSNLLTPPGLLCTWNYPHSKLGLDPIHEAMPCCPGVWIRSKKGSRRLQPDEVARGLGLPKDHDVNLSMGLLERSTSVFLWEALLESFQSLTAQPMIPLNNKLSDKTPPSNTTGDPEVLESPPFEWGPPDLRPGGDWHRERLVNL